MATASGKHGLMQPGSCSSSTGLPAWCRPHGVPRCAACVTVHLQHCLFACSAEGTYAMYLGHALHGLGGLRHSNE